MKRRIKFGSVGLALALIVTLVMVLIPPRVSVHHGGLLSVGSDIALAVGEPLESTGESYQVGEEVVEKRTRSSKTHWLGGNSYTLDSSVGAVHYQDTQGDWQEIDCTWWASTAPWNSEMVDAGYHVRVKWDFTAGQVIQFEKQGETVEFQPMALEWTNDLDQIQSVAMPDNVIPTLTNPVVDLLPAVGMPSHRGTVRWDNAYGEGIDFEWKCTATRLVKILEIESLDKLPAPEQFILDGGNPVLRLNLIFDPSDNMNIYVDGALWNKQTRVQTFDTIKFSKSTGGNLWGFMPLFYWGSNPGVEGNQGQSISTLEKRGDKLYISIRTPYEWLQDATYPIYIDQSVEVFPDHYRYFHVDAWNGDLKWLSTEPDGEVPASSSVFLGTTERQSPDAYVSQVNLDGTISDISEDPDSPDANWGDAISDDANIIAHVSFPTPTNTPIIGAGLQEFKIWVRKSMDVSLIPTVRVDLYENGALITSDILITTDVTNITGELFSGTWNAASLTNADGSGVEAYIFGDCSDSSGGWSNPTEFIDSGDVWTNETLAYDDDTLTFAYADSLKRGWTDYLELTHSAISCDKVQLWVDHNYTTTDEIEVDVYYDSAWNNIFSGEPVSWGAWNEYSVGSTQSISSMRIRFWASKAYADECQVMEADFWEVSGTSSVDIGAIEWNLTDSVIGDYLIQDFATEALNYDSLSAGVWNFYLWGNHDGSTLVTSLFAEVRKNNVGGELLATTDYTSILTDIEVEYSCILNFPQTAWNSGDKIWVGIYAHVTTGEPDTSIYFYYDHSTRLSRTVNPTIDESVSVSANDDMVGRYGTEGTSWSNTTIYFIAGYGSATYYGYGASARFTGVDIPADATVGVAYLNIVCAYASAGTVCRTDLCCENSNNPGIITGYTNHVNTTRTADVEWDGIGAWTLGTSYQSDSIVTPIQTVIDDNAGTGSALIVFFEDKDPRSDEVNQAYRVGASWDNTTYAPPAVHIEYSEVGPGISNAPDSKGFGVLEVNTTSSTTINFFTITNTGSGAVDITVHATDFTGGDDTWDLSDTATPGENIYGLYAGLDDDDDLFDVIVRETEAYNELVNNLAEDATQDWGLKLYMPTSVADYDGQQMSATVTLVCSAH